MRKGTRAWANGAAPNSINNKNRAWQSDFLSAVVKEASHRGQPAQMELRAPWAG